MTDFKLKPLIRRPSTGGEEAESIFGPVKYSFDGEYDSDGFISEVQVDLPWGPAEVFTNIDDADSWAEDQILQRILSARTPATEAGWRGMDSAPKCEQCREPATKLCQMTTHQCEPMPICDDCAANHDAISSEINDHEMRHFGGAYGQVTYHYLPLPPAPGTQPDMGNPIPEQRLARNQPCGCIVCHCEDDEQCQGCGAKSCGNHPVGEIPNPVFEQPATEQPSVKEAARVLLEYVQSSNMKAKPLIEMSDAMNLEGIPALFMTGLIAALRSLAGDE